MRRLLAPLAAAALLGAAAIAPLGAQAAPAAQPAAQRAATVVLLVRHAEKGTEPANDPPLTAAGTERARLLAEAVVGARPSTVFTTQFRRTHETAEPVARAAGVAVTERPITAANAATHAMELAREIRERHAGETVAVVGHSNTIPALVAALTGGAPPTITDDQYGDVFVVILDGPGTTPRVMRLHVGR